MSLMGLFMSDKSFVMTLFSFLALSFSSIDLARLFNIGCMLLVFKHRHCLEGNFLNVVDTLALFTTDDTLHSLGSMLTDN